MSFRLDALKFENLYKKLLPTISTFSYVFGQAKQACPTVQPIRHTRHNCSFTLRAWTAISKTGLKRSNLKTISIRHWYQSLLHLSIYIILNPLSDCKRFHLKLVSIFIRFSSDLFLRFSLVLGSHLKTGRIFINTSWCFRKRKESGTEIGHSLEFDFVVPPPHSWVGL